MLLLLAIAATAICLLLIIAYFTHPLFSLMLPLLRHAHFAMLLMLLDFSLPLLAYHD